MSYSDRGFISFGPKFSMNADEEARRQADRVLVPRPEFEIVARLQVPPNLLGFAACTTI